MQQTMGYKRFVVTRVSAIVFALGVLAGGGVTVAAVTAAGDLPWTSGGDARVVVRQPDVQQERINQLQRLYEAKLTRLEDVEQHMSLVAARAEAHEKLLRFYRHKEDMLDSLYENGRWQSPASPDGDLPPALPDTPNTKS